MPRAAASCPFCATQFRALCPCGAEVSLFDDRCAGCGASLVPRRLPTARRPLVRAAKWAGLALAVGAAAYLVFAPRPLPTWKLKAQAHEDYSRADFDSAAAKYRAAADRNPADAESWYMLAACMRELGYAASVYRPMAENAVLLAPGMYAARSFLARQELADGHVDRALEHAAAAARAPEADGRAFQLLAEIELARPHPDLARVQRSLRQARTAGHDTPGARLLLADMALRLYGVSGVDAGRLPPAVNVTLIEALSALDAANVQEPDRSVMAVARARLTLALGRPDDAFAAADGALSRLEAGAPRGRAAELRLVRGMALHARGDRAAAAADFAAALRDAPGAQAASAAASFLDDSGDAAMARALLAEAAREDASGGADSVLAWLLLREGDAAGAAVHIDAARLRSPDESSYAEIEGAVLAALGRDADSRAAYADAVRLAPGLARPRVSQVLAAVVGRDLGPSRERTLRQASAELESLLAERGDDPWILAGIGQVRLEMGDFDGARAALERAAEGAPADASIWRALALARHGSKAPDAHEGAAAAYARARVLEPDDVSLVAAECEERMDAGDVNAAVAACTAFLRRRPDEPAALSLRSRAYRRLAMWPSAAADLRKLREARPTDDSVLADYVDALFRAGDADGAARVVAQATPGATPLMAHYLQFLESMHAGDVDAAIAKLGLVGPNTLLAEVQLAAGRVDDAVATLREIRRSAPPDAHAVRLLVVALLDADPPPADRVEEARAVAASLPAAAPAGLRELLDGRLLLAAKEYSAAAERLAVASRLMPADGFAALFHGEALFRSGDRVESLAEFRRAAASPGAPTNLRVIASSRLLTASFEAKDDAVAESLAREAARLAPEDADAVERLADVLLSRGEAAEAARAAERALLASDMSAAQTTRLRLRAAAARLANGQLAEAQRHVDALDATAGTSSVADLLRGFVSLGAGRADDADRAFVAALASDPELVAAQLGRIEAALSAGRVDVAAGLYETWRTRHASDRGFLLTTTRLFARRGHVDRSLEMAKRAADAAPDDETLAVERASLLFAAGRPLDGVAEFRGFVARVPAARRAATEMQLGRFLLAAPGSAADALELARRVADVAAPGDRLDLDARVLESEALLALGDVPAAEAAGVRVLQRWNDGATPPEERWFEARVRFVLGSAAAVTPRRIGEAIAHLDRSLDLDPSDAGTANNLAWLLGMRADTAPRGVTLAKTLTQGVADVPAYWDTRARCSAAAGDPEDAETSWRRALELFAAKSAADSEARGRSALAFAQFLASRKRVGEARDVANAALEFTAHGPVESEIRRFIAELP